MWMWQRWAGEVRPRAAHSLLFPFVPQRKSKAALKDTNYQLNEGSMESDGVKQEMLHQTCCGCFFFHSNTVWKISNRNNIPTEELKIYKIFLRCILSFKMAWSDSSLPHFLSTLDRRFVFPVQLVTDTAFTCKCCSACSSHKHILNDLKWFISFC